MDCGNDAASCNQYNVRYQPNNFRKDSTNRVNQTSAILSYYYIWTDWVAERYKYGGILD